MSVPAAAAFPCLFSLSLVHRRQHAEVEVQAGPMAEIVKSTQIEELGDGTVEPGQGGSEGGVKTLSSCVLCVRLASWRRS